jgi:ubiquinone/menaquinone biosynthesis C-methylase UbiE
VLPFLTNLAPLGDYVLELGPGPGAATEWLHSRVRRLVALESDEAAAHLLAEKYLGANVDVIVGDATHMEFASDSFDSVASFTMLHHVPTFSAQQLLLREAFRVLKPGGSFLGSDSLASNGLHHFHEGDDYNPVDPATFLVRLQAVGFAQLTIAVDYDVRFIARKPDPSMPAWQPDEEQ